MAQRLIWMTLASAALIASSPASAAEPERGGANQAKLDQAKPDQAVPSVGIGAKLPFAGSVVYSGLGGLGGSAPSAPSGALLIPIRLGDSLRLEPHVGAQFGHSSTDQSNADGATVEGDGDQWSVNAGAAIHSLWSPFKATVGYAGLQAGISYGESSSESEDQEGTRHWYEGSHRTIYAGPVIGGEYQPTETFGFGVEAALVARYGTTTNERAEDFQSESSNVGVSTRASIVARVYLW